MEAFEQRHGVKIIQAWGMTETSPIAAVAMPPKSASADERWDERPLACVVLKDGEAASPEDLKGFLADRVAKWWLPERWTFIEEVPKTSVGKFDKKVLRARYADGELDVTQL